MARALLVSVLTALAAAVMQQAGAARLQATQRHVRVVTEDLLRQAQSHHAVGFSRKSSLLRLDDAHASASRTKRKLQRVSPATGRFTSITIPLSICGRTPSTSTQDLRNMLFSDSQSLSRYFDACSFGALSMDPSDNRIVTSPVPVGCGGCNIDNIAEKAENYVANNLNIDMTQYSVKILVFPANTPGCGFWGMARQGCFQSNPGSNTPGMMCRTWVVEPTSRQLMHETGHNLGLGHAMKGGKDAADGSCPMSNVATYNCPNAYHASLLGWTSSLQEIDINDLNGGDWQQVRLPPRVASSNNYLKLTGPGPDIYIDYSSPVGWESGNAGNHLRAYTQNSPSDWSRSEVIADLGPGDRDNLGGGYPRFVLRLDDGASLAGGTAQVCRADNSGDCKPGSEPSGSTYASASSSSNKKSSKKTG